MADQNNYDYRDMLMSFDIRLTKRPDGKFSASAHGREVIHHNSEAAVEQLQTRLETDVITGDLVPGQ